MRTLSLFLFATVLTVSLAALPGCSDACSSLGFLPPARTENHPPPEQAGYVDFVRSFPEALIEASQTGKPLLVFFSTPECIYCQQMQQEAFCDRQVIRLAEEFICVQIEAGDAPELCENYHIEAFPTVQFIASNGAQLQRLLGKKKPETLASQMQVALQDPHSRMAHRSDSARR